LPRVATTDRDGNVRLASEADRDAAVRVRQRIASLDEKQARSDVLATAEAGEGSLGRFAAA